MEFQDSQWESPFVMIYHNEPKTNKNQKKRRSNAKASLCVPVQEVFSQDCFNLGISVDPGRSYHKAVGVILFKACH